jgi:hypothetical protein
MTDSIFDQIVTTTQIENAIIATLQLWLPTYISEVERQAGLTVGNINRPRGWTNSYDLENWKQNQTPCIVLNVRGTVGKPERYEGGMYSAWFSYCVGCLVSDTTEAAARAGASVYMSALADTLIQQDGLGGLATKTEWDGYSPKLPDPTNRTLALGECEMRVLISNILTDDAGPNNADVPVVPLDDPEEAWPQWTTASTVVAKLETEPVSEPLTPEEE